jgi:hypothetical protein
LHSLQRNLVLDPPTGKSVHFPTSLVRVTCCFHPYCRQAHLETIEQSRTEPIQPRGQLHRLQMNNTTVAIFVRTIGVEYCSVPIEWHGSVASLEAV